MKDVIHVAAKDISDYLNERGRRTDVHVVTPAIMINKRSRYLNRILGITKINYFGSKMDRTK